jgi:hypothetical protein
MTGSQNWSAHDLMALAQYVEVTVPLGMNVWKRVEGLYNNEYAIPNNRQEREWDNMRDKWYKIVSDGPPTGVGEMPDALNEVFRVNDILEDIGGLVDPEDLPDAEGGNSVGRDGAGGVGGNNELAQPQLDTNDGDGHDADHARPAKKTFITSRPGTDGGSTGVGTRGSGSGSTMRRVKHGSASLAEKLLSSISPEAEARQDDNRAVIRLYLQQIRAQEETIRIREQQIDSLRQELMKSQDRLGRARRQADKLEIHLRILERTGTHRGRSSLRRHGHHELSLSPTGSVESLSNGSASSSRRSLSPLQSVLKSKRRRVDLPVVSKVVEKGKGKMLYPSRDQEDEEVAASLVTLRSSGGTWNM